MTVPRFVVTILVLANALALPACRSDGGALAVAERLPVQAQQRVAVPLVPYRLPLVTVRVPGGEALFCADTGATHTLFDAAFVDASGLSTGRWDTSVELGTGSLRSGSTDRWTDVPWMELGGLTTGRFTAIVADLDGLVPDPPGGARFGGVLGTDFLGNFAPFYDGPAGVLHLLPQEDVAGSLAELVPRGTAFQQLPVSLDPRPVFDVTVGDEPDALTFPVLVDSGAARTDLPATAIALLALSVTGTSEVLDVVGRRPSRLHRLPMLPLGRVVARDLEVGESGRQDALLGWDVLGNVPFVVDCTGTALWMRVPE